MADIELVIKIDEETYNRIMNGWMPLHKAVNLMENVQKGTPLPKGHGRLIDADRFDVISCQHISDDFDNGVMWLAEQIDRAPTLIEADREDRGMKSEDTEDIRCGKCVHWRSYKVCNHWKERRCESKDSSYYLHDTDANTRCAEFKRYESSEGGEVVRERWQHSMTKEEAIKCLTFQNEKFFGGQSEALKMAVSALKESSTTMTLSELERRLSE